MTSQPQSSSIKDPEGFLGGILAVLGGLVAFYFGFDIKHTNLETFYNPELLTAILVSLGVILVGLGTLKAVVSYFVAPR